MLACKGVTILAKRYYWLKLKEDFFSNKVIKKLRRIAGGDTYTIIYLKLQLLSLKQDGKIFFDHIENTFAEELALELDEDVDNLKVTLSFLQNNGLLEEHSEDEFLLPQAQESIGKETPGAARMRKLRQQSQESSEKRHIVTPMLQSIDKSVRDSDKNVRRCSQVLQNGDGEIEIERERELEYAAAAGARPHTRILEENAVKASSLSANADTIRLHGTYPQAVRGDADSPAAHGQDADADFAVDGDTQEVLRSFCDNLQPGASPMTLEMVTGLVDDFGSKWVLAAIGEAVACGGKSPRYLAGILERWRRDGFKINTKPKQQTARTKTHSDRVADMASRAIAMLGGEPDDE